MIVRSRGVTTAVASQRAETRAADWSGFYPTPTASTRHTIGVGSMPYGVAVPAIAAAVRLVSGTIAGFVMRTYKGRAEQRQPVLDTWQADLFQDPDMRTSSFQFWEDVLTSLELWPGAFILKRYGGTGRARRVVSLEVIDPDYVSVTEYLDGTVKIRAWVDSQAVDITSEVIHIRGWSPIPAATQGVGTTELHRTSIAGALDYESFRGRYFANDATPGLILKHPGMLTKEQRTDLLRAWVQRHAGADKRGLPGILWGGMDIVQGTTSSMRDAQGTELADAIVRDVAREFRIFPPALLHAAVDSNAGIISAEATADMFMRFSLMDRMRRVERAFAADRDMFPTRDMYPRFDTAEFTRGDIATMAGKVHQLVQVGVLTPNEGRAEIGLPPHKDGDILQITPVGGSPNPGAPTPAAPAEEPTPPAA